jgi:hypothetical protein
MARKLGIMNQWLFGEWADRAAINRNADELVLVEANLDELKKVVKRQSQEILQLRAMIMGVVEVLHTKAPFEDAELEAAVQAAWTSLTTPPPKAAPTTTDPYRGTVQGEPSADDVAAAKALLATAQDHHFNKRFKEAREVYQQIVDQHGDTKQASTARQQLDNLRR